MSFYEQLGTWPEEGGDYQLPQLDAQYELLLTTTDWEYLYASSPVDGADGSALFVPATGEMLLRLIKGFEIERVLEIGHLEGFPGMYLYGGIQRISSRPRYVGLPLAHSATCQERLNVMRIATHEPKLVLGGPSEHLSEALELVGEPQLLVFTEAPEGSLDLLQRVLRAMPRGGLVLVHNYRDSSRAKELWDQVRTCPRSRSSFILGGGYPTGGCLIKPWESLS